MKISEKQVLELISLAQKFYDVLHGHNQPEEAEYVQNLLINILNQQSDEPVERGDGS